MHTFGPKGEEATEVLQHVLQNDREIQEELATKTVEATSGGGMITVVANGGQEIVKIKIEKDVVDANDVEMLEDLVLAAVNEAIRQSREMVSAEMSKVTGGLNIPGLV